MGLLDDTLFETSYELVLFNNIKRYLNEYRNELIREKNIEFKGYYKSPLNNEDIFICVSKKHLHSDNISIILVPKRYYSQYHYPKDFTYLQNTYSKIRSAHNMTPFKLLTYADMSRHIHELREQPFLTTKHISECQY